MKKCNGNGYGEIPNTQAQDSDEYDMMEQFYVTVGPGFVVGLAGFCAALVFMDKWRLAYFRFMEDMKDRLLGFRKSASKTLETLFVCFSFESLRLGFDVYMKLCNYFPIRQCIHMYFSSLGIIDISCNKFSLPQ
ncbi:hypothetical protein GIB67_023476 [Kingdonia uniflora]|uniref:Uncharacterized protein n=1 Tax=Kingdonia uniflora TaxID=39325 RepID=A0A7J7P9P1_9MAGN|nr:hypothetical protein GIB67_023476 [Kingdonia uniflora]